MRVAAFCIVSARLMGKMSIMLNKLQKYEQIASYTLDKH